MVNNTLYLLSLSPHKTFIKKTLFLTSFQEGKVDLGEGKGKGDRRGGKGKVRVRGATKVRVTWVRGKGP